MDEHLSISSKRPSLAASLSGLALSLAASASRLLGASSSLAGSSCSGAGARASGAQHQDQGPATGRFVEEKKLKFLTTSVKANSESLFPYSTFLGGCESREKRNVKRLGSVYKCCKLLTQHAGRVANYPVHLLEQGQMLSRLLLRVFAVSSLDSLPLLKKIKEKGFIHFLLRVRKGRRDKLPFSLRKEQLSVANLSHCEGQILTENKVGDELQNK